MTIICMALFFSYFDVLHGGLSVLSSLLQKRSHCLQFLLHLTHIFCCAKELQDHSTKWSHTEKDIHTQISHTVKHYTLRVKWQWVIQQCYKHVKAIMISRLSLLVFSGLPCPDQSSCAYRHCSALASCEQRDQRRLWAAPGSSWVWHSCNEKAQPNIAHISCLLSGGSSHTSVSRDRKELRRQRSQSKMITAVISCNVARTKSQKPCCRKSLFIRMHRLRWW